jgi:hypothetical protein
MSLLKTENDELNEEGCAKLAQPSSFIRKPETIMLLGSGADDAGRASRYQR